MESGSTTGSYPVSEGAYGEGLPYAPENFPHPGDKWGWKVGNRLSSAGYYTDRNLYPPAELQAAAGTSKGLGSKKEVKRFLEDWFPGIDTEAFFASFTWWIPSNNVEQRNVDILRAELQQVREDRDRLNSEVNKSKEIVNSLEETCSSQREQISGLQHQLAAVTQKLKMTELSSSEIRTEFEDKKRIVSDLEDRLRDAEAKINEIYEDKS